MSDMIKMLRTLIFFSGSFFSGFCSPPFPLFVVGRTGGGGGVAGIPGLSVCCMVRLADCCTGATWSIDCPGAEGVGVIPPLPPTNVGLGVWQFGHISR